MLGGGKFDIPDRTSSVDRPSCGSTSNDDDAGNVVNADEENERHWNIQESIKKIRNVTRAAAAVLAEAAHPRRSSVAGERV